MDQPSTALRGMSMQELDAGNFLGSDVRTWEADSIWYSLAHYDASLRAQHQNSSQDWHYHRNPHFSFILEGGNVEHRKRAVSHSLPGHLLFYQSGELHQNVNVVYPSKNFNVEMSEAFFSRYNVSDADIDAKAVTGPRAKFTMLRLYKAALDKGKNADLEIHSLLLGFLFEGDEGRGFTAVPSWVGRVAEVINDRWDENLSLLELSREAGVHPTTISKRFPKYFSCTLGEYVRRLRVEKALAMIRRSDRSLTEVAHRCGFADQSHFTRVFKEMTGLLPKSYRKI
jgi:AraC family transcriptional regulator